MTVLPSIPAAPTHEYATHIPDRRPMFKTHKGAGQAKNAVLQKMHDGARSDMVVYRLEDGEYRIWLHILAGQKRDEIPELAPKPPPRSHVLMEIRSLVEQERYHLAVAATLAEKRRKLEAAQ